MCFFLILCTRTCSKDQHPYKKGSKNLRMNISNEVVVDSPYGWVYLTLTSGSDSNTNWTMALHQTAKKCRKSIVDAIKCANTRPDPSMSNAFRFPVPDYVFDVLGNEYTLKSEVVLFDNPREGITELQVNLHSAITPMLFACMRHSLLGLNSFFGRKLEPQHVRGLLWRHREEFFVLHSPTFEVTSAKTRALVEIALRRGEIQKLQLIVNDHSLT